MILFSTKFSSSLFVLFLVIFLLFNYVESKNPKITHPKTSFHKNIGVFAVDPKSIKKLHVIFMNHLDVGYNGIPEIGFIHNILNRYFNLYFPRAIDLAQQMRQRNGTEKFIYTTHPWLVSLYLDCPIGMDVTCPTSDAISAFKQAISRGDITYHATPFNMQPEAMDSSLFEFSITMAHDLDKQFGKPNKITMSQRDVPGMTRSVIPLLLKHGVQAISVGVNNGTPPPDVPTAFVWQDPVSNSSILAMWHPHGYPDNPGSSTQNPGGLSISDCVLVPGLDEGLAWAFRTDNSGPPESVDEILSNFKILQSEFPNAQLIASTFDNFVNVLQTVRNTLPLVNREIGDSWITGISSDPLKMSQFREISRARAECIRKNLCNLEDPRMKNFSRMIVKLPEHTWGIPDVGDNADWSNENFHAIAWTAPNFVNASITWKEQRYYIPWGIDALQDHPLANEIRQRLKNLEPAIPSTNGYTKLSSLAPVYKCGDLLVGFDAKQGFIDYLTDAQQTETWASSAHPLGTFLYRSYNSTDFDEFSKYYHDLYGVWWVKWNISAASPESRYWYPTLTEIWKRNSDNCEFLFKLTMESESFTKYGAPQYLWESLRVRGNQIDIDLQWFEKTSTRLPEALFFAFDTILQSNDYQWKMDKLGELVSPYEVILNGSQSQHGVWDGVYYTTNEGHGLTVRSLDAGLVSPGPYTAFPVTRKPNFSSGMGFNLFNNIWNTNYPLYYPFLQNQDTDSRFRFEVILRPRRF